MQKRLFLCLAVFLALPFYANAQKDDIIGTYWNEEKTGHIRIFLATDGQFYGKIDWTETPDKKDFNNPYPERRDNPRLGLIVLRNFTYDSAKKQWTGGTIYDPDNGKVYDCYMWFDGDDKDLLHLKGYVLGMKFMGREAKWKRVEEE
ncbi:MAG: DUF2147 domain-containing protein [Bacteroidales bacterium]|nr:DUF2147 domain-containing protein [Bacteroidales bacterium]